MKFLKELLVFLTTVVIFLVIPLVVFAAEGDILFSDDFNDGNLDGWTIESGNWYINNGVLIGSQSGRSFGGRINTNNSEWDNYRLDLDVNGFQGIDQGIGVPPPG